MLKINQIAIISGGLLLLVLAMPSYVFMIFETSSMAAGIFILACTVFLIYFCLIVLTSSHKFSPVNSQSALIILWLIFLHGIIAYIFLDGFDLRRFFLSYLLFLQVIVAAIMFLQMALNISNEAVNASIKFAFYILFFSGVAATFGLNPWAINRHKPVFFFCRAISLCDGFFAIASIYAGNKYNANLEIYFSLIVVLSCFFTGKYAVAYWYNRSFFIEPTPDKIFYDSLIYDYIDSV